MAYNNYSQNQQGYGQYNPYGQQNPYEQRVDTLAPAPQGYGQPVSQQQRPGLEHQASSRYDEERAQGGYEMSNVNGAQTHDPNRILNEVRNIDHEIDNVESSITRLRGLYDRYINDPNASADSAASREIDSVIEGSLATMRNLTARIVKIKQNPESGHPRNAPQVGKIDRRLKSTINSAQQTDRDYRVMLKEQFARQYRIVRPDASDQEVREAAEDTSGRQIFSEAIMSDRRGQSQTVLRNVQTRHDQMIKLEKQMIELAQLFSDLEAIVIQQDVAIQKIDETSAQVQENVVKANTELTGAVTKAAAARRKKWYCLGIVVLILIVIAIILGVVIGRR